MHLSDIPPYEERLLGPLSDGKSNEEIADILGISKNTVQKYVSDLYVRTRTDNRVALANWYRSEVEAAA